MQKGWLDVDKEVIGIAIIGVLAFASFAFYASSQANSSPATAQLVLQNPAAGGVPSGQVQLAPQLREITLETTNWAFSPTRIVVSKGDRIRLTLKNVEGTHGIAIPAFGVSLAAGAGESKTVEFLADKEGTHNFLCNVFCGPGHSEMTGQLIVEAGGAQAQQPTAARLDFQNIEIKATAQGFEPKNIKVKAGQPVKLSFTADSNAGCTRALLIKKAKISLLSKGGATQTAEFTPERGTYQFTCSMSMFRGEIQAE